MSLEHEIASWDGKSSSDIGVIYTRYIDNKKFDSNIIELSRKAGLQKGATWLLKKSLGWWSEIRC
jgi:hypothetical protein